MKGHLRFISWGRLVYWGLTLIATLTAFLVAQRLTSCWRLTPLPGIPPADCAAESIQPPEDPVLPEVDPSDSFHALVPELEMPGWDGGSRINIAFFGLRGSAANEGCPLCTDTILLLTVDPISRTAGMLSIPRDLWVNIPGFGYSRINTAWAIGENARLPGGGPGLAMETVSQFIGVPVHYYVQVDFGTFVSFVNLIGGIDVYVEEQMVLDPAGSGQDHFVLIPGDFRHLTGKRALAYARCRYESQGCSGGDVGRARRQQQVILAIRDKVLAPEYFPTLLSQMPELYMEFSSGVRTNMQLEDVMKLALLARDIPLEAIRTEVIDSNMTIAMDTTIQGVPANVLRPVPDLVRVLRDEIFIPGGPLSPLATGSPVELSHADAARIRIVNNTYTADLDRRTANYLNAQGMQVVEFGPPTGISEHTKLILYSSRLYTLRYLVDVFGVAGQQIVIQPDPASPVDLEIRLGGDWIERLPGG